MTRVGFIISMTGSGWLGGLNYYKSLFQALSSSSEVEVVLLAGPDVPDDILKEFPPFETVRSRALGATGRAPLLRKILERMARRAFIVERVLRKSRIDVLSHSGHLGPRSRFPTISWIPDFQHRRLPQFFSEAERRSRDRIHQRMAAFSSRVVLSSADARSDFQTFHPGFEHKAEVLHFVPIRQPERAPEEIDAVRAKYSLPNRYFHVPNQLWKHKNHVAIIEALAVLKAKDIETLVVSTGATNDYRHPGHFDALRSRAEAMGVSEAFVFLGLVPETDMRGIMAGAVAVINPSHFEGWSTTVEEAKAMGKTVILSDIPVHREQAPAHGFYFLPSDPAALAERMEDVLAVPASTEEHQKQKAAAVAYEQATSIFRQTFERIVAETRLLGERRPAQVSR